MKIFDAHYLNELTRRAISNPRLRQHRNVHNSYQDASQRLFNAIEPGSYIRPHRHAAEPRDEMLIGVRGTMALVTFDDHGSVTNVVRFGPQGSAGDMASGAEVSSVTWHTVIALESGCVLLEVKRGPFNPGRPKDLAVWAPAEGSSEGYRYLQQLRSSIL